MKTAIKLFGNLMFICMLSILWIDAAKAQENKTQRSVGLSAMLQQSHYDILIPVWVSDKVTISPTFSAVYVEDAGMDWAVGLATRFYTRMARVAPYFGLRAGALFNSPKEGDGTTDFVFGGAFGGEYFFGESFSIGVEAQANVSISGADSRRFGNPGGTNVNTATVVIASVYF